MAGGRFENAARARLVFPSRTDDEEIDEDRFALGADLEDVSEQDRVAFLGGSETLMAVRNRAARNG